MKLKMCPKLNQYNFFNKFILITLVIIYSILSTTHATISNRG